MTSITLLRLARGSLLLPLLYIFARATPRRLALALLLLLPQPRTDHTEKNTQNAGACATRARDPIVPARSVPSVYLSLGSALFSFCHFSPAALGMVLSFLRFGSWCIMTVLSVEGGRQRVLLVARARASAVLFISNWRFGTGIISPAAAAREKNCFLAFGVVAAPDVHNRARSA